MSNKIKLSKLFKQLFIIGSTFVLLGIVCIVGINLWVTGSTSGLICETPADVLEEHKSNDCILVLGAGLRDGKPSPMLKDRLDKGISCYQEGIAPKLLMSGDHGQTGYNEVQVMKQYAIDAGVPSSDIFMDHAGFSTYESLIRARDIFDVKSPVVITQKYHLSRALFIGKNLDLDCTGVPTENYSYGGQPYRLFREYIARCKDVGTVLFHAEPTYSGNPIPITGDGNVTND